MLNQSDISNIKMYIEDIMTNTVLDRTVFWQSIWADEKFPKSIE
jgi:hypothetical protein